MYKLRVEKLLTHLKALHFFQLFILFHELSRESKENFSILWMKP